jgi:hypothetical protein
MVGNPRVTAAPATPPENARHMHPRDLLTAYKPVAPVTGFTCFFSQPFYLLLSFSFFFTMRKKCKKTGKTSKAI